MTEAKVLDIQSYPIVYVEQNKDSYVKTNEIFEEDGNILSLINLSESPFALGINYDTNNLFAYYDGLYHMLIRKPPHHSLSITTREDEKIIFFFSPKVTTSQSNHITTTYILITNYGNIVSQTISTSRKIMITKNCEYLNESYAPYRHTCTLMVEGYDLSYGGRSFNEQHTAFFETQLLPERHVRVPQVFINILSIFCWLFANPRISISRGEDESKKQNETKKKLNDMFKHMCNEYMREQVERKALEKEHEALTLKCESLERANEALLKKLSTYVEPRRSLPRRRGIYMGGIDALGNPT